MTESNNVTRQHRPLMAGIAVMPSDGEEHLGTLGAIVKRKSDLAQPMNRTQSPPSRPDAMCQRGLTNAK